MKHIVLTDMSISNFKGIGDLHISFTSETSIFGENGSGKTTICDAFSWLLFNKDSAGATTFEIRPLDEDGATIDGIDINVTATIAIISEENPETSKTIQLSKTQKQKWVKKRGSDTATFQGNENTYEINSFPASEKEYKAAVADIVDEQLFTLLTNPRRFPSMKWQDQRGILLNLVSEISDSDVLATSLSEYEPIREDVMAAGAEKALEKARGIMKRLKDDQKILPARIDEASRAIRETENIEALIEEREAINKELADIRSNRDKAGKEATDALRSEVFKAESELNDFVTGIRKTITEAKWEAEKRHAKLTQDAHNIRSNLEKLMLNASFNSATLKELEAEMEKIKTQYVSIKAEKMDENALVCPTCGREYDADKAEEIRQSFLESKKSRLQTIKAKGDSVYAQIKDLKDEVAGYDAEIEKTKVVLAEAEKNEQESLKALQQMPSEPDLKLYPEYAALSGKVLALRAELNEKMQDVNAATMEVAHKEAGIKERFDDVSRRIALSEASARARERTEELRAELMDVSQKVSDQEQRVYLLEQFGRAKMNMLSDRINSKFKLVRFKLFDVQINGAVKDTCEMTINGVPFGSLNSAAKVQGGLDVINTLSGMYGVTAPIFIDNRESTSDIPEMDAQIINLYVSASDKELRVVNEE